MVPASVSSCVPRFQPALSDLDSTGLSRWVAEQGLPAYRARQLHAALSRRCVQSVSDLTDLPLDLRTRIEQEFRVRAIDAQVHLRSQDRSEKVLFTLADGTTVETVLIRSGSGARERRTVCVSSQVGCPAACSFCATGLSGFTRNLSGSEIADQVAYFQHRLLKKGHHVTNVVFMGMGEPLLNLRGIQGAIARLTDPTGMNLGARHLTVSTVGIVPQIKRFASWAGQVNLAVSLHAPNDELRSRLVPYNRHFPIASLMEAVTEYVEATNRRVSFEYVLLQGVNDASDLANDLAELLRPLSSLVHVNLIPWNPFREGAFVRSEGPDAERFAALLSSAGVNATIRYSKGLDISAACGQLREKAKALAGGGPGSAELPTGS